MKHKIVAIHKSDSCGKEPQFQAMINRTGRWGKNHKVWKSGTVLGPRDYECGDFYFDKPVKVKGRRDFKYMYFYAVSTIPVKEK